MIDHDRLFKELLSTFFFEFIELFFPIEFPDFKVLEFNYQVVQLNRLNWRDFLNQRNPVASALMAKMQIATEDRPKVKAECLRLLVTLRLDPAKMQLISGFIDTYLNLDESEEQVFQSELGVMQIFCSRTRETYFSLYLYMLNCIYNKWNLSGTKEKTKLIRISIV